jgi:hypothetical protein
MQLPEKYKENVDVSSEDPSSSWLVTFRRRAFALVEVSLVFVFLFLSNVQSQLITEVQYRHLISDDEDGV